MYLFVPPSFVLFLLLSLLLWYLHMSVYIGIKCKFKSLSSHYPFISLAALYLAGVLCVYIGWRKGIHPGHRVTHTHISHSHTHFNEQSFSRVFNSPCKTFRIHSNGPNRSVNRLSLCSSEITVSCKPVVCVHSSDKDSKHTSPLR